ncbi:unnamed protein product [Phyllotreta striolata]|uniref:Uncharacterized protein n=1 Tax=Phyllotreta striolata TaxID=444603 RepID=A0A9N9TZ10_PHYSR|nr:unnamed protein product [Phyllotreta striolata]
MLRNGRSRRRVIYTRKIRIRSCILIRHFDRGCPVIMFTMRKHSREFTAEKILLFACVFVITVVEISSKPQIDCRIHLYAPICRGVAAKRDDPYYYNEGLRELAKKLSWDYPSQQYT